MALKGFMARGMAADGAKSGANGAGRENEATAGASASRPTAAEAPAPRTVSPSTSVDASSELEGRLRCKETLRIDGRIRGEIECEKSVLVGEGARVLASIAADEVRISGLVEGDITARRKITLERTAEVTGDLTTPGIVIEEGAKLQGRILIGSEARKASAKEAATASKDGSDKREDKKASRSTSPKPDTGPVPVAAASA